MLAAVAIVLLSATPTGAARPTLTVSATVEGTDATITVVVNRRASAIGSCSYLLDDAISGTCGTASTTTKHSTTYEISLADVSPGSHTVVASLALNDGGSATGSATFTVTAPPTGSPTLTTQIAVTGTGAPVAGQTTLADTATLTDFLGAVAGEVITFHLYGPFAEGVTPTCIPDSLVFTTTGTLGAGGVATTATTFTPTLAGTYTWRASYDGNTGNDPATHACGQANESVTLTAADPG